MENKNTSAEALEQKSGKSICSSSRKQSIISQPVTGQDGHAEFMNQSGHLGFQIATKCNITYKEPLQEHFWQGCMETKL